MTFVARAAASCGLLAAFVGCASADDTPPMLGNDMDAPEPMDIVGVGPCNSGDVQECSIILGVHNGIVSCYHGKQLCTDGEWGPCEGGEVSTVDDLPGVVDNIEPPSSAE